MAEEGATPEQKLCGACLVNLPNERFSKKQWQQKQRRRCKGCAESGKEIDLAGLTTILDHGEDPPSRPSSGGDTTLNRKKKGDKKDKPVFDGDADGRFQPIPPGGGFHGLGARARLAYDVCAWCGKVEENDEFMACSICKNALYCSGTCQKSAYPQHKLVCQQLKQDRKNSKKERRDKKRGDFTLSEASGTGSFFLDYHPGPNGISMAIYKGELRGDEQPGQHFASKAAEEGMKGVLGDKFPLFCRRMKEETLKIMGDLSRTEMFTSVDELNAIDQFLLSCGPLDDIDRAKEALPYVLHQINLSGLTPDGSIPNIGDITVRGYGLNALEWASRRGNFAIADWLATDPRTKVMLTRVDSAPVAWACYTNRVELARMLVERGADSHSTTPVVFGRKPPSHLASENGKLLSLKFLVEECGHDIHECDMEDQDIRVSLRRNNRVWAQVAGCVACDDYAKSKGVLGEMSMTNKKAKAAAKGRSQQQTSGEKKLEVALNQLKIAGGREEEPDDDDDGDEDNPGDYLNELLAVADARNDLGQYSRAGSLYYRAYYAAMHSGPYMNNPAIFPIAHKMILAKVKTGERHDLSFAHGMAQQNIMMPGHPAYIQKDLEEVEKIMTRKGMKVERFVMGMGMGMGGMGGFRR